MRFRGIFASSVDPTGQTLSLTIESASKVLIGLATWFAVAKGMDPAAATTQLQALIDLAAQAVPLMFTFYHIMQAAWGIVRKLYTLYATRPSIGLPTMQQAGIIAPN